MRTYWRDGDRTRRVEITPAGNGRFRVDVDGVALEIEVAGAERGSLRLTTSEGSFRSEVTAAGTRRFLKLRNMDFVFDAEAGARRRSGGPAGGGLESPMPGVVTRVLVTPGDRVTPGQPLLAVEAMKMEHLIRAPHAGRVRRVAAAVGEMVNGGTPLVELEEETS